MTVPCPPFSDRRRLTAIGRAYVGVAAALPAHCQVMWREDLVDALREIPSTSPDELIGRFTLLLIDGMVGASSLGADGRPVGAVGHGE